MLANSIVHTSYVSAAKLEKIWSCERKNETAAEVLNHVEKLRIIHVRLKIDEDNLSARWECAVLAADTTEIYMADECRMVKGIEAWSEISGRHSSAGKARRYQWILTGDPEPDNNPLNLIQASWSTYME